MKNIKLTNLIIALLLGFIFTATSSCERVLSDDVQFATLSGVGEIFTDNFVGLGTFFYFPYVGDGAKPDVFSVDTNEGYESVASIRIDVPNANDPAGNFAGANFVIDGSGRNLTEFDALTFWIKSSQATSIASLSFGDKFRTERTNVDVTTNWQQYIIPIPDPSRLVDVKTVFAFSAAGIGSVPGSEVGYTFWIDELKFEKLGTIAQPRPAIFNGEDVIQETFVGSGLTMTGLTQTFNLASGLNQTVSITPSYFTFSSSDVDVARVSELGAVSIVGIGTAEITAILDGVKAEGSLTIESLGSFVAAPTPTQNPADVISIFSDAYSSVNDLNFAVFNDPNVQIEFSDINGEQIVEYSNLSFIGMGWEGTSDVSAMTHLHLDVQVTESTNPALTVQLLDFGPDNADNGEGVVGDDTAGGATIAGSQLEVGAWVGIDIPLNGFTEGTGGGGSGSPNLSNMARVILVSNGSSIIVDNIYFYKE